MSRFNVVAVGPRDYYQVAIALHEAGQLGYLITDFYSPSFLSILTLKRRNASLKKGKTFSFYPTALLSKILLPGSHNRSRKIWVDDLFGFVAGLITFLTTGRAVVYSYYLNGFTTFYRLIGSRPKKLICFQVHPSPWFINELMDSDAQRFSLHSPVAFEQDIEGAFSESDNLNYVRALSTCDSVICASGVTARSIADRSPAALPFSVIPYGSKLTVDLPRVAEIADPEVFHLLTVCQLTQRKGMHWAFAAMNSLRPADRAKFRWTIVSNEGDRSIRNLAPDNATFVSNISDNELARLMQSADLFVLPSIIEGFGLVYAEALALGTPIVYTRNTGADDICTDGVHGFRIDYSSHESVLSLFYDLINGTAKPSAMRGAAESLGRALTWDAFREKIREVI